MRDLKERQKKKKNHDSCNGTLQFFLQLKVIHAKEFFHWGKQGITQSYSLKQQQKFMGKTLTLGITQVGLCLHFHYLRYYHVFLHAL